MGQDSLLKISVLSVAAILSFASRLFSVLRFESVIHEFDPYFNYRTTRYLADNGFYSFHNWFDDRAWCVYTPIQTEWIPILRGLRVGVENEWQRVLLLCIDCISSVCM